MAAMFSGVLNTCNLRFLTVDVYLARDLLVKA
jgi:hypothetical protein